MPSMQNLLHSYLLQYKRLSIPGVGLFTVEHVPARLDFPNKTLHPPLPVIRFSHDGIATDKQLFKYLSRQFSLNETEAIRYFNDFAFDFKNDITNNGEAILPGIGKITKTFANAYSFQPAVLLGGYFPDLKVERVIRENAEHTIRVGEDEKTSTQMHELLAEEPKKDLWWIYALILGAVGIGVIVYYHLMKKG